MQTPATPVPGDEAIEGEPAAHPMAAIATPQIAAREQSIVVRALQVLKREPILFFTVGYIALSLIGLWASYWFYAGFHVPILEYMQAGDLLVAGLRDPVYFVVLGGAALFAWLVNWPERWRTRNPGRAEELRRRWWARWLLPNRRFFGMAAETGLAFAIFWCALWLLFGFVIDKGTRVRAGGGHMVRVTLAGQSQPLPGTPRLLGSSGGFVFLYWPVREQAEAMPLEAIARLQSIPVSSSERRRRPPPPATRR